MPSLDLLSLAAKAEMPERLTDIGSWHRHMPFAFTLLDMLEPRVFVELGTHKGDSYSAFCQGVVHQGLATRCYAVDTWQGDSQAGQYGDDIYSELSGFHDPRYGDFSTLLRMTFDEALAHFSDGSVDLLHIDGLHTYDAVKHDFETWLPKMSERGVVIFHDTNVHYGDFAVWQLWAELVQRYPGFEFPYGFGLGVLAVGAQVPAPMLDFLQLARSEPRRVIQLFHALGDGIELFKSERALSQRQAQLEGLGADLQHARDVVAQRDALLEQYNQQRDELLRTLAQQQQVAEASGGRIAELTESYMQSTAHGRRLQARLGEIASSRLWRARNRMLRLLGKPHRVLGTLEPSVAPSSWQAPGPRPLVDVIIPVYRGLEETKACIESVLTAGFSVPAQIIVIEDGSPDPQLVAWLRTLDERVTLLHNEQNLGFVKTVNRGMALHPERDVLLLNSDTEVAGDWLARLQQVAYGRPRVGSVTPFSNSATICSYPRFCQDNELPTGLVVAEMDELFRQANPGQCVAIPTAIGFCMYIRRDCLDDCGLFDAVLFGRGYGEENEFCMRSAERGWQHLFAGDTFVYHKGGVSFAETQSEHQKAGHRALTMVYPRYDLVVREHIMADPARRMRFAVDLLRARRSQRPVVLLINHSRGGGTQRHLHDLARRLAQSAEFYLLQPVDEGGVVSLGPVEGDQSARLCFDPLHDASLLLETLQALGVVRIHFHHTIGVHLQFLLLPQQLGVPYDVTVHDYYLACPQITLTDERGRYCGAPDESGCNDCLKQRPAPGGVDIQQWRAFGEKLLCGAERVFTPSVDTRMRMQRYFPDAHFVAVPHEPAVTEPLKVTSGDMTRPQKVLVLGALSVFKGADLLEACALLARRQRAPLEFHLLGYAYRELAAYPFSNLHVHGAYDDAEVETLIRGLAPDLVWFPGTCPETYSYTLSTCLKLGLPVVAPQVGAYPERLAGRPWSWLLPIKIEAPQVLARLMEIGNQLQSGVAPQVSVFDGDYGQAFTYEGDYLAVEMIGSLAPGEPDWRQLHEGWAQLGSMARRGAAPRFPLAVGLLRRVLGLPGMGRLVRVVSPAWKQRIKQVLWHA